MNIEDRINECKYNLNQIKHFDPDPFYVEHFFNLFVKSIGTVYNKIFEEANNDFGLFVSGEINKEKFKEKAIQKKDHKALDFVNWFENKMDEEHKNPYPQFMREVIEFANKFKKMPKMKIMMRSKERYSDDPNQEILVNLANGKIRSKEELEIEMKRNMPVFLEVINHKRVTKNEPKINEKQVTASTFVQINQKEYEIAYLSEIYIPVLRRICTDSLKKIQEMTQWK
ncbi:hypothetical protein NsoK4_00315 [Nitrosopumilus sp. K4]|uniref:hypothetical protein n=1 Tax=Nitrosopumilus sp. K4 TaxID=2795383 RepID=UPI001BA5662A|nr:hypothetical protein [Nitrosopumilus sp. K4]QUC64773.1 hypothetical protein NsoK4_00315 [Nitrosopumilus sp. K4]